MPRAKPKGEKPKPAAPAPAPGQRRLLGRLVRRLARGVVRWIGIALGGVVLWVGAYTVIDPPGDYYMAREWLRLGKLQHSWRDLDEISPDLARAAIAAEDATFCEHWGFDIAAIEKALTAGAEGKRLRGASTISQQVAKNVFLWQGRSWLRKGLEAGFTVLIEAIWTKRRIVEVYLNTAEFDAGVFGAEAAAQHYFHRPAAALTLDQAARLAAVLPDPKDRSPVRATAFMNRRAAAIADGARTLEAEGRARCIE